MTNSPALAGPTLESPARWRAGEGHGLVWPHGLALVSGTVEAEAIEQVWLGCRGHTGLGGFLELLSTVTGAGLLGLPDFAVAVRDGGTWRVAARGTFTARAVGDGADRLIEGSGFTTWAESRLAGLTGLTLAGSDAEGPERPLLGGIVPAGQLAWSVQDASTDDFDPAPRRGIEVPTPVRGPAATCEATPAVVPPAPPSEPPAPLVPRPAELTRPDPALATRPERDVEPPVALSRDEAPRPAAPQDPGPSLPKEPPAGPLAPSEAPAADASTDILHLWEETIIVPVEQAAIRQDEGPAGTPGAGPAGTHPSAGGDEASDTGLGDHDGETITAADLIAATRRGRSPGSVASADAGTLAGDGELLGSLCAQGHANPPQRSACRVCGDPVVGEPRRVPRPPLGRIRTSTGEVIDLVVPIVVGRNPRADRFQGPVPPRLLALPYGHVSGTHLSIQLEGWNALAVDQHSRNGTFLRRRGEPPTRLPQTPILLIDGDVLDLGHGVTLTMEELP